MEKEKILKILFKFLDLVILKYKINFFIFLRLFKLGFKKQKYLYKLLILDSNYLN